MTSSDSRPGEIPRPGLADRPWLLALLCAVLGAVAFAPALGGDWIRDDGPLIAANRYVHGFGYYAYWFTSDFWDVDHLMSQRMDRVSYWRPLVSASYAVDWVIGGGSPVVFHATNLLGHALVGWLCYFTLRRWTGHALGALAGTLIFVLHPTKAESVAWITGRTDIAVALAMLLATWGIALRLQGRRAGIALEASATALAYMVKEQAVVLPVVAAVEGWVAAGRPALSRDLIRLRGPVARAVLPQVVVAGVYLLIRQFLVPLRRFEVTGLDLPTHVGLVFETLGRYVAVGLWPADMSMDWAAIRSTVDGPVVSYGYAALGVVAVGLAIGAAIWWRRSRPHYSVAIGFVLVTLIPVSNVVWAGFITLSHHRFWYVPMLGIALAAAFAVARAPRARWVVGAALTVALALGVRAGIRALDYSSSDRFWDHELAQHPDIPWVVRNRAERELGAGRPRAALQRAACAHQVAMVSFSHSGEAGPLVLMASEILAGLTPDQNTTQLLSVHRFVAAILAERPDPAVLETSELRLSLPQPSKAARQLRRQAPRLLILLARIDSRLGRDAEALASAERAVAGCTRCPKIVGEAAWIAARAGAFEQAERWQRAVETMIGAEPMRSQREAIAAARAMSQAARNLPERRAAQLHAQRYVRLQAWGRAYAVLAKYRAEIEQAGPGPVLMLAQMAYFAGDVPGARALLERHHPQRSAVLLAEWASKMGWDDDSAMPQDWTIEQGCAW